MSNRLETVWYFQDTVSNGVGIVYAHHILEARQRICEQYGVKVYRHISAHAYCLGDRLTSKAFNHNEGKR